MTTDTSVLNVRSLAECPEYSCSRSSALSVINGPGIAAADLAILLFVGAAALITELMTSCVNAEVMFVTVNTEGTYLTSVKIVIMTKVLFIPLL